MRRSALTALACLALAQAGCNDERPGAAGYSCGQMGDSVRALREQAAVLVSREGLRPGRLSREEAILDAEFQIRRACDGAAGDEQPYNRAAELSSPGWFSPGTAR
jgi:hypothetical protein